MDEQVSPNERSNYYITPVFIETAVMTFWSGGSAALYCVRPWLSRTYAKKQLRS